jgi:hypothetical protein
MWHGRSMAPEDEGDPTTPRERVGHLFGRSAARPTAVSAAAIGLATLAWWEGAQHAQTDAAQVSMAASIAAVVLSGAILGAHRQQQGSGAWLSDAGRVLSSRESWKWPAAPAALLWVLLLGAVLGWDFFSFLRQSQDFPTLSYLTGRVTRFHLGRSGLYLVWLVVGVWLVLAHRRTASRKGRP